MKSLASRNLKPMLEEGREAELAAMLASLHPADVAEILSPLGMEDTIKIMSLLDIEQASDVLVELSDASRDQVAAEMPLEKLTELVAEMDSDDAADIVAELPDDEAHKLLAAIDLEDSDDVRRLMMYDGETAGGLMRVELIAVLENETVDQVVEKIRNQTEEVTEVSEVFVVDESKNLRGLVDLKALILANPTEIMKKLMYSPDLTVKVDENQEEVAKDFHKYGVQSAPVVDSQGRLLGLITVDDIIDVVQEETDKDFYRLAGSSEEEVYSSGPLKIARLRVPWLLFNIGGGFVTSAILTYFEHSFIDLLSLLAFVPMVMGLSGAVGSQSATITVRGLATGRLGQGRNLKNLGREMAVAVIIAFSLGLLIALVSGFFNQTIKLGAAVGVSIITAILVSTFLGAIIPLFFKALKIDPAMASGPVVTSTNDVVSLTIYMFIGTSMMSL